MLKISDRLHLSLYSQYSSSNKAELHAKRQVLVFDWLSGPVLPTGYVNGYGASAGGYKPPFQQSQWFPTPWTPSEASGWQAIWNRCRPEAS